MLDMFDRIYAELVFNANVLLTNLTDCPTVDRLWMLACGLLGIVALRVGLHFVLVARLRRWASPYAEADAPDLYRVYDQAVRAIGVRRVPVICKFRNARPLAFTIGIFRPIIFLAPRLLDKLSISELRALLMHELAHVKRLDALRFWGSELFVAAIPVMVVLLFAVHFVASQLGNMFLMVAIGAVLIAQFLVLPRLLLHNEKKCDDIAVEASKDPAGLASSLVRVAQVGHHLPVFRWQLGLPIVRPFAPRRSLLRIRVRRLGNYRRSSTRNILRRLATATTIVATMMIAALVWQFHADNKTVILEMGCECIYQVTGTVVEKVGRV